MTKSEYATQLRDPRWKAKRLEVLERDGHKCTKCSSTDNLHVLHTSYIQGRNAWEYELSYLTTLCRACHKEEHPPVGTEASYVKMYTDRLDLLYNIDGADVNLLVTLTAYMNYENIVDLVPRIKDEIMTHLGWTNKASLSTSLYRLKKSSVIFSVGRGSYRINPYLFAKGGWTNVSKIRTTIEYSLTGRVVTHDFETRLDNE